MKKENIILATDNFGNNITISQLQNWINTESKIELADFFYHRFYGRYIKPFDFKNSEYIKTYKNGFAIMTSCCLLIETFVSFTDPFFLDTNQKSERCFGYFFLTQEEFIEFSKGGLKESDYRNSNRKNLNNKGISNDFYKNVRCGILHNGEVKNNWRIVRNGVLFDTKNKVINSHLFLQKLKDVMKKFKFNLKNSNIEDEIWKTYLLRLESLIKNS